MSNHTWQLVLICWGEKYNNSDVLRIVEKVRCFPTPPRVLLITDRPRLDAHFGVTEVAIPDFYQPGNFGSQTKLCMFEAGIVPADLPAIYLDLDTMVMGDLRVLTSLLDHPRRIAMLQSTLIPFGKLGCLLHKITNGRWYTRGNSSIVVYHPAHCNTLAENFRQMYAKYGFTKKGTSSDEAFIAFASQDRLRNVPNTMAVKFAREFMMPFLWMSRVKGFLPWVQKRRQGLVAVTFPGQHATPEKLVAMSDRQLVIDHKGRKTVWSTAYLGTIKATILETYASLK